jgi:hypothetical protein
MQYTKLLPAALIALLAAACSTPGSTTKTGDMTSEQKVAPPGPGFLVQYTVGEASKTAWLEVDGGEYKVLARTDGAFAAGGVSLWRWETRAIDHEISNCECVREQYTSGKDGDAELAQCRESSTTQVPVLHNASGGQDVALYDLTGLERTGDISIQATNRGTVGSYWFGTVCTYIYACGAAHGSVNCRSVVADLASGELMEFADFMGEDAFAATNERLRDRAIDALEASAPEDMQVLEPHSAQLEAGWPVFTDAGLAFDYLFAASTCYACSDGSWSSYSIGVEVRDNAVPAKLEPLASPPAAVVGFLETEPIERDGTVGWTALPDKGKARAALMDDFRSATADPE